MQVLFLLVETGPPHTKSHTKPGLAIRTNHSGIPRSKPFQAKRRQKVRLARKTLPGQFRPYKTGRAGLSSDERPVDGDYWLIWAKNPDTGEEK